MTIDPLQDENLAPEQLPTPPSAEEILNCFRELIKPQEVKASQIPEITRVFLQFLQERPPIPAAWQERFAQHGGQFDYYQICLPEDLSDPYLEDEGNLKKFLNDYCDESFLALEHHLLSHNYFIFTNGHADSIPCPRPILMLESDQSDQEIDWDCTATFFADGSYCVYNLDGEREEVLGRDHREILGNHLEILKKLVLRIPVEGEDFGNLGIACEP